MSHRVLVESTDVLEQTLSSLESTEALVLRLRTGLVDGRRHTLREVGEFLGTTRSVEEGKGQEVVEHLR